MGILRHRQRKQSENEMITVKRDRTVQELESELRQIAEMKSDIEFVVYSLGAMITVAIVFFSVAVSSI
jgi:predicted DNA-binding protein with PD1-like motif